MKRLFLISIVLIIGCSSSPTNTEVKPPQEMPQIDLTYRMLTFSGDKEIRVYAEDSLVASAIEGGRWEYTASLHQGDTVYTEITFPETHYGQTTALYTSGEDTIGTSCNFFGYAPAGHKFKCGFTINENHIN